MINQYDLSRILGSEIVGKVEVGHAQMEAGRTLRAIENVARQGEPIEAKIDKDAVCQIFLAVRTARGDERSPDLYVADQVRNDELVFAWRASGVDGSVGQLNRCLLNARKHSQLKGLKSKRVEIDRSVRDALRFVCELVATQMRYEYGASVDDLICEPRLSVEYDSRCRSHLPGYTSLEYRWTILSVRKAGRRPTVSKRFPALNLQDTPFGFTMYIDLESAEKSLKEIPNEPGLFLLTEGNRELYVAGADKLRESIQYHSQQKILSAVSSAFWHPTQPLKIDYGKFTKHYLPEVENWLIKTRHPVFNVPRSAAA